MKLAVNFKTTVMTLGASLALVLGMGMAGTPVFASGADDILDGANTATTAEQGTTLEGSIADITEVLLFALAAVSVIMIIVGGFRFTTSNGNADQVRQAKNIILYSVAGLVVAILAYAIVQFVVTAIAK